MAMIQRSGRTFVHQSVNQWLSICFVGSAALGAWFIVHTVAAQIDNDVHALSIDARYQKLIESPEEAKLPQQDARR